MSPPTIAISLRPVGPPGAEPRFGREPSNQPSTRHMRRQNATPPVTTAIVRRIMRGYQLADVGAGGGQELHMSDEMIGDVCDRGVTDW